MPSPKTPSSSPPAAGPIDLRKVRTSDAPLICFSHLRWDFVVQRPQHLMRLFARNRKVFFFEEYIPCDHPLPYLEYHPFERDGIIAIRPRLPHWWDKPAREAALRGLLAMLVETSLSALPLLWFYTPQMFRFADRIQASAVVYDCMDELANFKFADPHLRSCEAALMARADVVFTGGYGLYEEKRALHSNIHPFPSAVDAAHFKTARRRDTGVPADQAEISGPILGFFGVIDERIDLDLLRHLATARPQWSIVMIGPIAKIDPANLPRLPNIHWLGGRHYDELPAYLAGWNVALMPFAINEATRFISPTKTPEYLAGGRPVVSTPVADVQRQYGGMKAVRIAAAGAEFIVACEAALGLTAGGNWLTEADAALAGLAWERTFAEMSRLISAATPHARLARTAVANDKGSATVKGGSPLAAEPITASPTP